MKLRFVEGGGIDSKVIRWDSRCRWSHVEAIRAHTVTLGAQLKGGVRWRSVNDPTYRRAVSTLTVEIPATGLQERRFWDFLDKQNGKPYDWRAIIAFGLGSRDWREEDSWFCSELQARALEVAGLINLPADIPVWRITPRDVWILVAGIGVKQ